MAQYNCDVDPVQERLAVAPWLGGAEFVFLVGCPRSGTTWLQALLASHPEVMTGPETHFFASFAPLEKAFLHASGRRAGLQEYWSADDFYGVTRTLFTSLVSRLPQPRVHPRVFLEKTPQHGEHARFISRVLPGARFLHLVRDPRAVVASLLRASSGWGDAWAPASVDDATHLWLHHIREARKIRELDPGRYAEVRYEDLRADPEAGLRRLLGFLGLEAGDTLVRQAVAENTLERARAGTAFAAIAGTSAASARPAYPEGFVGDAPVEPDAVPLSPLQRRRVEHLVAAVLRELDYPGGAHGLSLRERLLTARPLRRLLGLPAF